MSRLVLQLPQHDFFGMLSPQSDLALNNPLLQAISAMERPGREDIARWQAAGQAPTAHERNLMSANPTFREPWWLPPRVSDPLTGETSPARAQEMMSLAAGMPLLGVAMGAKVPVGGLGASLFHGTGLPPKGPGKPPFEKFSVKSVGGPGGEGAQAYGHGLYFAENPSTAGQYRSQLAGRIPLGRADMRPADSAHEAAAKSMWEAGMSPEDMLPRLRASYRGASDTDLNNAIHAANPGSLIEADIPDTEIAKMLDWDKPLSEQPEGVKENIRDAFDNLINSETDYHKASAYSRKYSGIYKSNYTGEAIYEEFAKLYGPEKASRALGEMGIPGIKYLDQGSRLTGDAAGMVDKYGSVEKARQIAIQRQKAASFGDLQYWDNVVKQLENPQTRNLVVFDDSIIAIKSVNGEPVK